MTVQSILITGSEGFVGKNLIARLKETGSYNILAYDIQNTAEDLMNFIDKADIIFHFAGVNRTQNLDDFFQGNKGFTEIILEHLKKLGKKTPVMLSSSIQAALANPYGQSKKNAEDAVFQYGHDIGAKVYVYRFPNLFGKWCRPNYNSVVATFCHNIARGLPITVSNPDAILTLAHIDDVVDACMAILGDNVTPRLDGFCYLERTHSATVQEIADKLKSFRESRENAHIADVGDDFTYALYSTYLSYLPEDAFAYSPELKTDNRGHLFELIKSVHGGQIFISTTKPGITRGNHYHHLKTEKFVVLQGRAVIRFRKLGSEEIIEYPACGEEPRIVDIPPGYTHHIENTGADDLITLFWASEIFCPDRPDTYFLKV